MLQTVFKPRKPPTLKIEGSEGLFPVNEIFCVGRNYADHAVEMGHDPDREPPFFFMKGRYALMAGGGEMRYPAQTQKLHHEVELVVALARGGNNLSFFEAAACIFGYAVGIDLTRRDLQEQAKQKSRPWEAGKSFFHSAPCSSLVPIRDYQSDIASSPISLSVNGNTRQEGNTAQMLWKIPEIISRLSMLFPLDAGDLIYTGTPAGVGALRVGDDVNATLEGLPNLKLIISR